MLNNTKYNSVVFVSLDNPNDSKTWSGIPYFILNAFKKNNTDVHVVYLRNKWFRYILTAFLKILSVFFGGKYDTSHSILLSLYYGLCFSFKLKKYRRKKAIVIAPASSSIICFLKTSLPIVYISDATFQRMINYYPGFTGLSKISIIEGNFIEKRAIEKSTWNIFASEWAADSAVFYYKADIKKIHVIPFGANIKEEIKTNIIKTDISELCYLLFLGVNWERKGGDIAYQCFCNLRNKGYNVHLTICGCVPPFMINDNNVTIIPFLNKNREEDYHRFVRIMNRTHWLILPTKAECFGIVFCEASAYSIPSITYNTGGVKSAVYNNVNGILLNPQSSADEFADKIEYYIRNKEEYQRLSKSSFELYYNKLNWMQWLNVLNDIINHE